VSPAVTYSSNSTIMETGAHSPAIPDYRLIRTVLWVCASYYLGAKLGFALTLRPSPISTLWPPNSILLAALLLTPVHWWGWVMLAALPAHLAVELPTGFPPQLVMGWFVSNCSEALIGAAIVRHLVKRPLRFDRSRDVGVFIFGAAFLGTFLSCFLDAGFVTLSHASPSGFWELWQTRFLSNVLASLTLVPVIVTWGSRGFAGLRALPVTRYLEAAVLGLGLLIVAVAVFNGSKAGLNTSPALLYAPLPFVLWAAVRFGTRGTSTGLLIVAALAIWGAVHGHGPFLTSSPAENAVSIQLFLIVFAIPLLVLAAVIQERRHAEEISRENEERLSLALGAAQVGTWEWRLPRDAGARHRRGLDSANSSDALAAFLDSVSPEDRGQVRRAVQGAIEGGGPYECEFRTVVPGNEMRWVLGKGKVLYDASGHPVGMLGVNVDITERKIAEALRQEEATLRESEARLRELANAMPQIVWTATGDGRLDYFNRRYYDITGAPETVLADQSWLTLIHPDDRQSTLDAWQRAVATGEPCEVEHRLRMAATGEYRWHLARALPVRDSTGALARWYGSSTDIQEHKSVEQRLRETHLQLETRVEERTADLSAAVAALEAEIADRVAAERALRSSEERFSKAFHSSPDAIAIVRQSDYRFIEVNEKWQAMFGFSREEVVGRSSDELNLVVHPEQADCAQAQLEEKGYLRDYELDLRNRSGKIVQVSLVTDTLEMVGEACFIINVRDVTAQKRAEMDAEEHRRELAHLSRVASLGELSGALAHELNQPLAAILANTRAAQRLVTRRTPDLSEIQAILEDIALDDRRAGEVIGRLRVLLKKGEPRPTKVDLNDLVTEVRALLHSDLIRRRVATETKLAWTLPPVFGERVELQQVLLNLVQNACDAMAGTPSHQRLVTISTGLTPDGCVQLSVEDRGHGIPPERLNQIFDAFFTTKENGLGLGLAICRSIVTAHGGRLWAENNSSPGATFHLMLDPADSSPTDNR
jgi:PAS domain S-box-containing protein